MQTKAFAAQSATTPLAETVIDRREPGSKDVLIDILYCGVCHSDLHTARGEWGGVKFPSVPGHEIVGRVSAVGGEVTKVAPGDIVGVGCMVDSCRTCHSCEEGLEQFCEGPHGFLGTYNGWMDGSGDNTFGGYSAAITVDEHFVLRINHDEADLAAQCPALGGERVAEHAELAGARAAQAGEEPQQGGLAGAIAAEERDGVAGGDREIEVLEDGAQAVCGDEAASADREVGGGGGGRIGGRRGLGRGAGGRHQPPSSSSSGGASSSG